MTTATTAQAHQSQSGSDGDDSPRSPRRRFNSGFHDGTLDASWARNARDVSTHYDPMYAVGYKAGHANFTVTGKRAPTSDGAWFEYQAMLATQQKAAQGVPDHVRRHVLYSLTCLREVEASLEGVQRARGNGHILALEVRDRTSAIEKARAELDQFRTVALKNGVDGDAFIQSLGGQPNFARFGEAAPAPVQTPCPAEDTVSARPRMRM